MLENKKKRSEKTKNLCRAVRQLVSIPNYEDGIDADVPQARIFAVGITNFSHSRQTMVLNNVTISSDFENIVNIPPCFPTAISLWHYRFDIITLKCALKTHFLKYCNILQATRHYNITSYSITYYLRATYASPHVESSASYRLEDRLRCRGTGIGGPRSRSRARASSSSLGHGDRREQQQETVFADFFSVSFIVFIFPFCYFGKLL